MRYAFQVAYDGARYFGFVRQPEKPTVEAELLGAFKKCGLYRELKEAKYRVAARTDRGASAICQVVSLDVLREPKLQELNAALPENITVLAIVAVKPDFDPRTHVLSKHYRYVCEAPPAFDLHTASRVTKMLEGAHDFSQFCKRERGKPMMGEIRYASVRKRENLVFDFIAPSFLWQQVRRMVWAVLAVGTGRLGLEEFGQMLEGRAKHSARPAPAEGLFLVGVRYPLLALRPDARAAKKFIEHSKRNAHPVYGEIASSLQTQI